MKTVVITRKYWGKSYLRINLSMKINYFTRYEPSTDDKKCCLGFICESYNVPSEATYGVGMPRQLPLQFKNLLPACLNGDVADQATGINDGNRPWPEKEKLLKSLFRPYGIRLVFRGKR